MVRPKILLIAADLLALFVAVLFSYWIRFQSGLIPVFDHQPMSFYVLSCILVTPLYLFLMFSLGNFRDHRGKFSQYEVQSVIRSLILFYMTCLVITFFLHTNEYSRTTVTLACLSNVVLCLFFRQLIVTVQFMQWRNGSGVSTVLLLGNDPVLKAEFQTILEKSPHLGYRVWKSDVTNNAAYLLTQKASFDRVILVGNIDYSDLSDIVLQTPPGICVDLLPPYHVLLRNLPFKADIASFHLIPLNQHIFWNWYSVTKRMIDVVLTAVLMLVLSPIFLVISIAIRFLYGSPILFSQQRVGQNGLLFTLHKFRTMKPDSEKEIADLISSAKQTIFKLKNDSRVEGNFAWFLRKSGLDELPQLWNVLRGDMSLVGPRPATVELVKNYSSNQKLRLTVAPGITGLQQTQCRGSDSMEEVLKYDFEYVAAQSIWLDLVILARTVKTVLSGRGVS